MFLWVQIAKIPWALILELLACLGNIRRACWNRVLGAPQSFCFRGYGWGLMTCPPNKAPGDTDAASLETTPGEPWSKAVKSCRSVRVVRQFSGKSKHSGRSWRWAEDEGGFSSQLSPLASDPFQSLSFIYKNSFNFLERKRKRKKTSLYWLPRGHYGPITY